MLYWDGLCLAFTPLSTRVGVWGNKAADGAAYEAPSEEPTDDLMPFSDLKPLTAIYQVWQKEWNQTLLVSSTFHEILPKLSDNSTRKEDTVRNIWVALTLF